MSKKYGLEKKMKEQFLDTIAYIIVRIAQECKVL